MPRRAGRASPGVEGWRALLGAMFDPVRLRALRVLDKSELGVGELARVLKVPQSTASRHLKALAAVGLVTRRANGTLALYRAVSTVSEDTRAVCSAGRRHIESLHSCADDDTRLQAVLRQRRGDAADFFGRIGQGWDAVRTRLFGQAFSDVALCQLIDPSWTVADVGCGTGQVAERLADSVAEVVAIDRELAMVEACRKRLAGRTNCEVRQGDLLALPAAAREFNAVVMSLVLHHIDDPARAVVEAARTIRPGGWLLVIDMAPHDHEEFRSAMGHKHLGFSADDVLNWCAKRSLLVMRRWQRLPAADGSGPGLFAALLERSRATSSRQPRRRSS